MPAKPARQSNRRARQHGLYVTIRPDTGALQITGYIKGYGRVRQNASSSDYRLACEEAAALEATILRTLWHGERRGVRPFSDAVESYLESTERSPITKSFLVRIVRGLGGDPPLSEINQQTVNRLRTIVLKPDATEASVYRTIIGPLQAVMNHANQQGWCEVPRFIKPKPTKGRTKFLLPAQAELLVETAAQHLDPLLIFLLTTGARMSEALELEWRGDDVDLQGRRVNFWNTKTGEPRLNVILPMRTVLALAALPHREGRVFRTHRGIPYNDHHRIGGGQILVAFRGAIARANQTIALAGGGGIDPSLTPHDLRHTWATWHYALHKDPFLLRNQGGWSSVEMVERYAHLMPAGQEAAIRAFRHELDTGRDQSRLTA